MNHLKTSIQSKENKRKRNFAAKLLLLIILEFFYEGDTILSPFLVQYSILYNVVKALIFLLSANLLISLGRIITLRFYLQKTDDSKVQPNFVIGIDRISSILNVNAIVISFMLAFGIKPLEFLTSITIVAAAIAILTKDFISNIINGLIIMFSDQLEIGDKIHIGKSTGFIRDITLSNIILKNDTGEIIIIPNSMVLASEVINYSKNNTHQMIFDTELPYSTELQLSGLEEKLNQVLTSFSEYVFLEGAQLNVLERKAETLLVRYQFPIKSGEKATEIQVRKVINQALIDWSHEKRKA
ncbi:MAG: mechanosensitive ion channel [Algoriphagus sp.]|nr:mechanosensitive ion channel [Algoriphagus sp.]